MDTKENKNINNNSGVVMQYPHQYANTKKGILDAASQIPPTKPEYIRLPKPNTLCPYTGLCRSTLRNLSEPCEMNGFRPPVRATTLRLKRGQMRGIRLIDYDSLMAYLKSSFKNSGNDNAMTN